MHSLIYTAITSLDGYIEDGNGNFDWSAPDEEVHAFINNLERPIGTYLYGRRLYEVMLYWEMASTEESLADVHSDYARIWQAADKIVYSRSLDDVSSARTIIEREFDAGAIRQLKATAARDISIGGAELAAHAVRAGLIDEYQQFVSPIVVGGGKRFLPDDVRIELELLEQRRFDSGVVFLRYRNRS
jgi:dihydrofolate reductase